VHSTPGEGSRFEFLLPWLPASGQARNPLDDLTGISSGNAGDPCGHGRQR
jgi:hypothetical protein